jgi:TRAP-type uncharacterized transport system substrate-binding protein
MVRRFGGLALLGLITALVAAACGGSAPAPETIVIEKEVIKEVEVEVVTEVIKEVEVLVETEVVREVEVLVEVTATPTAGPVATPTTNPETVSLEFRLMASAFYASFVEGWRVALDINTGGRITMVPEEATGDDAVNFLRSRPEEAARTMYTLTEEQALMWQEGGINFNGELAQEKRPTLLWSVFPAACMSINTLTPEIETVTDLAGKRMHLWTNSGGSAAWYANMSQVLKAAGIFGQTTMITGGKYPTDALADREVDAIIGGIVFADSKNASSGSGTHRLAQATGTFHFVDIPPDVIETTREQNPRWAAAGTLQRVTLYPGYARKAFGTDYNIVRDPEVNCLSGNGVHIGISPDADAEAVYQMTKAIIDNRMDVGNTYWPYLMPQWGDRLGHIWAPQEMFHPGSKRAFEETGLTFGTPGIREWEAANPDG